MGGRIIRWNGTVAAVRVRRSPRQARDARLEVGRVRDDEVGDLDARPGDVAGGPNPAQAATNSAGAHNRIGAHERTDPSNRTRIRIARGHKYREHPPTGALNTGSQRTPHRNDPPLGPASQMEASGTVGAR
ncbi:hypothetical protein GCM10009733_104760 [Nonomuraea maheshkhaliensis]|uniref:Uncharacterized protein n=1 Tax=Nonomuraea maheshkhaliensis TaxID=419590 RepID=A0ABP4TTW3_9ACTN